MNLLDPKRPAFDKQWSRIVSPLSGQAMGQTPVPFVSTEKKGLEVVHRIRVNIHMGKEFNSYETIVEAGKLDDFFQRWINDLEGTLEKDFKVSWDGRTEHIKNNPVGRPLKEPPKALSLDELFS